MVTVAYLGPEKTNTHTAALQQFGKAARYVHAPTVEDVFLQVERRYADYGVVPVENSLEGSVTYTLDRFIDAIDTPVKIQGEVECVIEHCLILHRGTQPDDVAIILSHPQALAQCSRWLDRHLKEATRCEANSTAEAVELLFRKQPLPFYSMSERALVHAPVNARAAIARCEFGRDRRLRAIPIVQEHDNKTRFLVLGFGSAPKGTRSKTSILFATKDQPGALHDALVPFKRHRINLTKIESRPSKRKAWEYLFFIDFEGHEDDPRVQQALRALEKSTALLRVLGSYPVATPSTGS
jgi:chorismate mutase/prephenate dehydratase